MTSNTRALAESLRLFVMAYPFAGMAFWFYFWFFLYIELLFWQEHPSPMAATGLVFLMGFFWNLLIWLAWWGVLKSLWSKPPQFLCPGSWKRFLLNIVVSIVATLPLSLFYIFLSGCSVVDPHLPGELIHEWGIRFYRKTGSYVDRCTARYVLRYWWMWLWTAFCLYKSIYIPSKGQKSQDVRSQAK